MNPPFWFPFGSMGLLCLDMLAPYAPELEQEMQIPATLRNVSHPIAVADIPAMYAGVPIDPGPAGFGDAWLQDCPSDSTDLARFKLVYLGSPYTKYAAGIEQAFRDVSAIAAEMLRDGVRVYSPIAHTHPIAVHGNLDPLNHEIWLPFDQAMMDAAEAMVVADMSGWRESYGVKYEIDYFRVAGKPVYFRSADGTVDKLR